MPTSSSGEQLIPPQRRVRFELPNVRLQNSNGAGANMSNNNNNNNNDEEDNNTGRRWGRWKRRRILDLMWRMLWYLGAGTLSFLFLRSTVFRWIFNLFSDRKLQRLQTKDDKKLPNGSSFIDDLFESPFLDDNEELRLRPVSVNTYVYLLPTHQNEDGIFVKLLIENTSELATE